MKHIKEKPIISALASARLAAERGDLGQTVCHLEQCHYLTDKTGTDIGEEESQIRFLCYRRIAESSIRQAEFYRKENNCYEEQSARGKAREYALIAGIFLREEPSVPPFD